MTSSGSSGFCLCGISQASTMVTKNSTTVTQSSHQIKAVDLSHTLANKDLLSLSLPLSPYHSLSTSLPRSLSLYLYHYSLHFYISTSLPLLLSLSLPLSFYLSLTLYISLLFSISVDILLKGVQSTVFHNTIVINNDLLMTSH